MHHFYNKGNSFIHADSQNLFFKFFSVFIFGCVGSLYWTWAFLQLQQAGWGAVNSSLWCMGFSLRWLLTLGGTGSRQRAFRRGSWLWGTGSVVPWHVDSSQIRDGIHASCLGSQILIHCATREVPIQEKGKSLFSEWQQV